MPIPRNEFVSDKEVEAVFARTQMNARKQIRMDRDMLQRARAKAAEFGVSLSEYVRRLVVADLSLRKASRAKKRGADRNKREP